MRAASRRARAGPLEPVQALLARLGRRAGRSGRDRAGDRPPASRPDPASGRAAAADDVAILGPIGVPGWSISSPLLRRVLLVNALPLALLVVTLLYLGQYQNGLLAGEVNALREQARIYAGALGQSAVRVPEGHRKSAVLVADLARPLLRRLTEPTPFSVARLYAPDGQLISDSNPSGVDGTPPRRDADRSTSFGSRTLALIGRLYEAFAAMLPSGSERAHLVQFTQDDESDALQWSPDLQHRMRFDAQIARQSPPYIRRTSDNRLLVTVSEPVEHDGRDVGSIVLTRAAGDVDRSLEAVRRSILDLFLLALVLTVALSWYLARTIARPILLLARAALTMRAGEGRRGTVPAELTSRADEIGELGLALEAGARALWARMDATERFAADVSHEIKNPLSSISSAIETIRRIDDRDQQRRLLAIIAEDVGRLDRLISDISTASRVDAELSRAPVLPVPVEPILRALVEIHEATRGGDAPVLRIAAEPAPGLVVLGVEDRLVQVLRNLIGNAVSFSPPGGVIELSARSAGAFVEISVADEGPGIPEARLEHIFERFYSERPASEAFGQHSGLGLSICRQIVEALRGRIGARNRPSGGAVFTVSLPRARQPALSA